MGYPSDRVPDAHLGYLRRRGVIIGLVSTTALLTNPQDVTAYDAMCRDLEKMAVFGDEARAVFERIAEQYRGMV